jgi:uncharacterized protein (DUF1778 family)
MSRITIDVSDAEHQEIKAMAAIQGKSIKSFVMEKLFTPSRSNADNTEDQAWGKLKELLDGRIKEALEGEAVKQTFMDVFDERLAEREAKR